ncbi:HSP18 transcriptional regulator [Qaidamihabitans albus]|uniref:HSP18 transcriptional regulator n=1 Tax=Qaidamihabitans albus TaxID=2795733 RepID=UPI0018F26613|nr:HSP18 transcriptional regulator [Qaidamihabitans albus]
MTNGSGGSDYERLRTVVVGAEAGERLEADQVLAALVLLRRLRDDLTGWEPQLIAAARELGTSWADLAPALGVASRQAAERRYLRLRPGDPGLPTADARVQAARDRRAGDRAVAVWARENSAALRRLAGQVGALEDLGAPAQAHVDRVQDALDEGDAAALLPPLAGASPHLAASHPALAERIDDVTERTERLRRDTQDRRDRPR